MDLSNYTPGDPEHEQIIAARPEISQTVNKRLLDEFGVNRHELDHLTQLVQSDARAGEFGNPTDYSDAEDIVKLILRNMRYQPRTDTGALIKNAQKEIAHLRSFDDRKSSGSIEMMEGLIAEIARLQHVIDADRYTVTACVNYVIDTMRQYLHLRDAGRGSYSWDDERYQQEFGMAYDEIEISLQPLRKLAMDKTNCSIDPEKVKAARIAGIDQYCLLLVQLERRTEETKNDG